MNKLGTIETLSLKRSPQGARIKAFEVAWLDHLGFTAEERKNPQPLLMNISYMPGGVIMIQKKPKV